MSKSFSFGKLDVSAVASLGEAAGVPKPDRPFRIVLMGDFGARANRGVFQPESIAAGGRLRAVDWDNFDELLAGMNVEIRLPVADEDGRPVTIRFAELDDFHPDRIYERVEVFQKLRELRRKLENPKTFDSAAAEVRSWAAAEPAEAHAEPPAEPQAPAPEASEPVSGSLFEQLLEETERRAPQPRPLMDLPGWDAFLEEIVRPHLAPKRDPKQAEYVASVDDVVTQLMRSILHHPEFQAVEAAWQAVHFLLSRLELDTELKLYLLDVSKAELAADLGAGEDLQATATYKLLVEQTVHTPGGQPWAVMAGNYTFDPTRQDAELLGRMAKIAREAGAPFISAAGPRVLGCESLAATPDSNDWKLVPEPEDREAWESLRGLRESSYLGLVLPRFLLRLPYGARTSPTERFHFEEMPDEPGHECYLWGNPCVACVCLLGEAFGLHGWDFPLGVVREIGSLPVHVYKSQGESEVKPCAEVLLPDRVTEAILEKGVMVLLSYRNQNLIRLVRFQSLSDPPTELAGRWS